MAHIEECEDDDDDDDYSDWSDVDDDERDDDESNDDEYSLRGLRLFMNRIEGHEIDPDDLRFEEDVSPPAVEYIMEKLVEKNVSMEELVKSLLWTHAEYADYDTYEKIGNSTREKIHDMIHQYKKDAVAINL
jgi:hypothetical protein